MSHWRKRYPTMIAAELIAGGIVLATIGSDPGYRLFGTVLALIGLIILVVLGLVRHSHRVN